MLVLTIHHRLPNSERVIKWRSPVSWSTPHALQSRFEHRLSWQSIFLVYLSPSRKCRKIHQNSITSIFNRTSWLEKKSSWLVFGRFWVRISAGTPITIIVFVVSLRQFLSSERLRPLPSIIYAIHYSLSSNHWTLPDLNYWRNHYIYHLKHCTSLQLKQYHQINTVILFLLLRILAFLDRTRKTKYQIKNG
jgi:hypothetical protein